MIDLVMKEIKTESELKEVLELCYKCSVQEMMNYMDMTHGIIGYKMVYNL